MKNGRETCIEDVLYAPGISSNLLSLGQLLQKGFKITMKDMMMLVYEKNIYLIIKTPLTKNRTFNEQWSLPRSPILLYQPYWALDLGLVSTNYHLGNSSFKHD